MEEDSIFFWSEANKESLRVLEQTKANAPSELDLLHRSLSLYMEAFMYAKPSENADQQTARMGLVSQNFNTLMAATDLASKGYYVQSIALLRNVYENWLSFWYLAKHPSEAQLWLDPQQYKRKPKIETMRNRIDHSNTEAKNKCLELYQVLSGFAHTSPVAILDRYRIVEGKSTIGVGVEFEVDDFKACCYALVVWLGSMLYAIGCWIEETHEWHAEYNEVSQEILAYIEEYNLSKSTNTT